MSQIAVTRPSPVRISASTSTCLAVTRWRCHAAVDVFLGVVVGGGGGGGGRCMGHYAFIGFVLYFIILVFVCII